ncbi:MULTISPECIES: LolA-like protein [Streptomyces]|uniref:hypothetical protein n=1 Tax=Streptomyces TaxID=1883 RepID=UPI00163BE8B5|nr:MULTISPECIES: hypothetical protein [Streptomyces]MBC2875305.1 hypothetical protein [Streptomyces sp. TYQ1024]UBI37128.1 hypothetical protein K7I03_12075 [Streptomyces mobaraensis]UKW29723.1 hypothetical protein MCU78_12050 [Streptomyces sp. TYQ1024]
MRRSTVTLVGLIMLCTACGGGGSGGGERNEGKGKPAAAASPSRTAPAPRPADDGAAVRAAAAATARTTARVDERIDMSDGTTRAGLTIRGALDLAGGKGDLRVRLRSDGRPPVPLDEVFAGRTVYFRMPQEPTGKTSWRSTRRDRAEVHYLFRAPMNDPTHVLRQVAMLPSARKVGEEKVNGTPTTHYRAEPDLKTLTHRMVTAQRTKLASHWGDMRRYLLPRADVWVDRQGRVVRTRFGMSAGTGGEVSTLLTLSDLGKPVHAPTVPPGAPAVDPSTIGGPLAG